MDECGNPHSEFFRFHYKRNPTKKSRKPPFLFVLAIKKDTKVTKKQVSQHSQKKNAPKPFRAWRRKLIKVNTLRCVSSEITD